jgi:alpha-mannosidase
VLTAAGSSSSDQLRRDVFVHRSARLFVPGAEPIESAWVPQADLRGARAIPAVLVAGADEGELHAEIARMASEIADGAVTVTCIDPEPGTLLDDYTVGLLTYGIPGFAVDTSGALHLSLLRSCTGWPSGVWLDPPRRQTPDGSAFQLQHWTHDFGYSLVAGAGDWRRQDLVSRGLEHSTPMLVRVADHHGGELPTTHSLLAVSPEREVQLQAVKLNGNPSAAGESVRLDAERSLTVRLTEATGSARTAQLFSPLGFAGAHRSDLLESDVRTSAYDAGVVETDLEGAQIATLVLEPEGTAGGDPALGPVVLGVDREIAQPVYSRYWLHNRGPAPMGFLPVSVSVSPTAARAEGNAARAEVTAEVTVASQLVDADFIGVLTIAVPSGWSCEPVQRPIQLAPGGHTTFPLDLVVPEDAQPGLSFVRVQLSTGPGDVTEDVLTVLVPGSDLDDAVPTRTGPEIAHEVQLQGTTGERSRVQGLEIDCLTTRLELAPGEAGVLAFRLDNRALSDIDGELMAISPWGTWDLVAEPISGFSVSAGSSADVAIPIAVPVAAEPGEWWVMVKFMWFGRVHYSPAVPLAVRSR